MPTLNEAEQLEFDTMHNHMQTIIGLEREKQTASKDIITGKKKFKSFVFAKSIAYMISVYLLAIAIRFVKADSGENILLMLLLCLVFCLVFTYGFNMTLIYSFGYPYLINKLLAVRHMNGDDIIAEQSKLFERSAIISTVLGFFICLAAYNLWARHELSPLLDIILMVALFIHAFKGFKTQHIYKKVSAVVYEYEEKIYDYIINHVENPKI